MIYISSLFYRWTIIVKDSVQITLFVLVMQMIQTISFKFIRSFFRRFVSHDRECTFPIKGSVYQAMHLQEGTVYPVIDQMDGVGYNATWFCIYSPLPWSTVVEAQMPLAEAYVQRMLMAKEIDKPTGPKNLELFEVYSTGTDKPLSTEFFPLISGANPNLEIYLDTDNAHQGNYAAKVCYVIDKADKVQWTGFSKELGITWATNDTLTFWAKGDGTLQKMTIKVQDSQMEWTYTMNIEGGDGKAYEIPLSEFSPPDWWEGDAAMDLSKIDSIAFQLEASGEHFVYMDDIRVIAKNG